MKISIRKLNVNDETPMDLLLLADPSVERVKGYLDSGICYVAEESSEIIGVYVLLQKSTKVIELINVAVKESKQGVGIGKQLIDHAIQTARTLLFKRIEVGTGNSSIGQLALYQKCGFRIIGIERNFFIENYDVEIFENGIWC